MKKYSKRFCAALFCAFIFMCGASARTINIIDCGAIGDGKSLSTAAIQAAIDAVSKDGGGTVLVPMGRFLSGSIFLKSNVELHLEQEAVLLGSARRSDYEERDFTAFIISRGNSHVSITGRGTIDGQGRELVKDIYRRLNEGTMKDPLYPLKSDRPDERVRPELVKFVESDNIVVRGVLLKDGACWVNTYTKCRDIIVDSLRISSTAFWNNDGMDIVDCRRMTITHCDINSADDGICLKSSKADLCCDSISISDCRVRSSASALKFGTASTGGFRNITVERLTVYDTFRSAIALESVDGGVLENILISDVTATNTGNAIFLRLGARNRDNRPDAVSVLRNITIRNVTVEVPAGVPDAGYETAGPTVREPHNVFPCSITGLPGHPVEHVTLENIRITYPGGATTARAHVSTDSLDAVPERPANYPEFSMFGELPAWGLYLRHVDGVTMKNCEFRRGAGDYRPCIVADDVRGLRLDGTVLPASDRESQIVLKNAPNASVTHTRAGGRVVNAVTRLASSSNAREKHSRLPLYKDPTAPIGKRVEDLLQRMTLEEKTAQMQCLPLEYPMEDLLAGKGTPMFGPADVKTGMGQYSLPSFSASKNRRPREHAELTNRIQKMFMEQGRLGIPIMFHEESLHGFNAVEATNYPTPLAMACSFDPDLVKTVFTEAALEASSRGTNEVLTPVLDLGREPRWGRTEETYGEDPYLVSRMGVAAITGFQGAALPLIDRHHVAATMKHFAAHGSPEGGRNIAPAVVDERTFLDVLLKPFKAAVQEAGVKGVMASYNEINGVPSHASTYLLTDLLRTQWGFTGAVVSDWYGIPGISGHGLTANDTAAAAMAVEAGVDMDLPTRQCYTHLASLVREKKISVKLIDRSVRRLLRLKFELGLFDHPFVDPNEAERLAGCAEHRATALKIAERSITLLKNENGLLPLSVENYKKIAVIGPNADRGETGNYANEPKQIITILQGIRDLTKGKAEIRFSQGVRLLANNHTSDTVRLEDPDSNAVRIREAVRVANDCDVVILCLGAQKEMQREAWADYHRGDNANLDLRSSQNELVQAIQTTGKPIVVVLSSGTPLAFGLIKKSVPSIVECWYLGQEAGTAVANVLFGRVNPGGKLSISIPASAGQLPVYYNHKPTLSREYEFDETQPLYPFGFGLSYSTFTVDNIRLEKSVIKSNESVKVFARVTNTGAWDGDEVVQLYIRDVIASVSRPVKELKDFKRITLAPGESKTVELAITPDKLSFHNIRMKYGVEPGAFDVFVGTSSRDQDLKKITLNVVH